MFFAARISSGCASQTCSRASRPWRILVDQRHALQAVIDDGPAARAGPGVRPTAKCADRERHDSPRLHPTLGHPAGRTNTVGRGSSRTLWSIGRRRQRAAPVRRRRRQAGDGARHHGARATPWPSRSPEPGPSPSTRPPIASRCCAAQAEEAEVTVQCHQARSPTSASPPAPRSISSSLSHTLARHRRPGPAVAPDPPRAQAGGRVHHGRSASDRGDARPGRRRSTSCSRRTAAAARERSATSSWPCSARTSAST